MEEHEVIAYTALHLINKERAEIGRISTRNDRSERLLKRILLRWGVSTAVLDNIQFRRRDEDIVAYLKFQTGRRQKVLEVEAKGGDVYYNLYTSLGQFVCCKKSPSSYYWFAFAFPYSWRRKVRERLCNPDGKIKPIIKDIISTYTKSGQGLWFYFVKEDGTVLKETWRQALR